MKFFYIVAQKESRTLTKCPIDQVKIWQEAAQVPCDSTKKPPTPEKTKHLQNCTKFLPYNKISQYQISTADNSTLQNH